MPMFNVTICVANSFSITVDADYEEEASTQAQECLPPHAAFGAQWDIGEVEVEETNQ